MSWIGTFFRAYKSFVFDKPLSKHIPSLHTPKRGAFMGRKHLLRSLNPYTVKILIGINTVFLSKDCILNFQLWFLAGTTSDVERRQKKAYQNAVPANWGLLGCSVIHWLGILFCVGQTWTDTKPPLPPENAGQSSGKCSSLGGLCSSDPLCWGRGRENHCHSIE